MRQEERQLGLRYIRDIRSNLRGLPVIRSTVRHEFNGGGEFCVLCHTVRTHALHYNEYSTEYLREGR